MEYTINMLAKLAGVSRRTLRWYDECGLLPPKAIRSNGYRIYGSAEVDRLQQILFYRELGLELSEIGRILDAKTFDSITALESHHRALLEKRARLDALIDNVTRSIGAMKGETEMSDKQKFEGFKQKLIDENERQYGAEIRQKYGEDAIDESNALLKNMSKARYDEGKAIEREFEETLKAAFTIGDPAGELAGLISSGITTIEMGNALGLGAYEANGSVAPLTDEEYLQLIKPYLGKAEIGMFMGYKNATQENIDLAAKYGLKFLRIGANAGDGAAAVEGIKRVKAAGIKCYFSVMKAYILSPAELAEEAAVLEEAGLDGITLMDSAGFMDPDMTRASVAALVAKVKIPVGFHGHSNLGMSTYNAIAAVEAGAQLIDCGLLGMARSAGNCSTELVAFALEKKGLPAEDVKLYELLDFLDAELIPAMAKYDYRTAVTPNDLIYGYAGCHSSFSKTLETVAAEKGVHLYKLIVEVSKLDQKAPNRELMEKVADTLK